jgi:hypothetical protein
MSIDEFLNDRKPCELLTEFGDKHNHTMDCDLLDDLFVQAYKLGEQRNEL